MFFRTRSRHKRSEDGTLGILWVGGAFLVFSKFLTILRARGVWWGMEAGRVVVLDEACGKLGGRDRVLQL